MIHSNDLNLILLQSMSNCTEKNGQMTGRGDDDSLHPSPLGVSNNHNNDSSNHIQSHENSSDDGKNSNNYGNKNIFNISEKMNKKNLVWPSPLSSSTSNSNNNSNNNIKPLNLGKVLFILFVRI